MFVFHIVAYYTCIIRVITLHTLSGSEKRPEVVLQRVVTITWYILIFVHLSCRKTSFALMVIVFVCLYIIPIMSLFWQVSMIYMHFIAV